LSAKEPDWMERMRRVMPDPAVQEAFIAAASTWTRVKGQDLTKAEHLAHIESYLQKAEQGEYTTVLHEGALSRRGRVTQVCVTARTIGMDVLLIRPPTVHDRTRWKLVGGKQASVDLEATSDVASVLQQTLASMRVLGDRLPDTDTAREEALMETKEQPLDTLAGMVLTGVRELNEEAPFMTVLPMADGSFLTYDSGHGFHVVERPEPNTSGCYILLDATCTEVHHNRNPEPNGHEKYPGIPRDSWLMYLGGTLVDALGRFDASQPVTMLDGTPDQRWIPLTSTVVEWLSEDPLKVIPHRLLYEQHHVLEGPITMASAHHVASFVESFVVPNNENDGATLRRLDDLSESILNKQTSLKEREQLVEDTGKQGFARFNKQEHVDLRKKKGVQARWCDGHVLIDDHRGYVIFDDTPSTTEAQRQRTHGNALHNRSDQFAFSRNSGKIWDRNKMPHHFRYRQQKRASRSIMLDTLEGLHLVARARDLRKKKETVLKETACGELLERLQPIHSSMDEDIPSIGLYLPIRSLHGAKNDRRFSAFTDISDEDMKGYIRSLNHLEDLPDGKIPEKMIADIEERAGGLYWSTLMQRTQTAWEIMHSTPCHRCNVARGTPCHENSPSFYHTEKFDFKGREHKKLVHKSLIHEAIRDHVLRDFLSLMDGGYTLPAKAYWAEEELRPGFRSGGVRSLSEPLHPALENGKKTHTVPPRPFSCNHRKDAACKKPINWDELVRAHINPAHRQNLNVQSKREERGTGSKGGRVREYISSDEGTEPPLTMQNLMADVVKRELALRTFQWSERLGRLDGQTTWGERLLWEYITAAPEKSVRTVAIDAPTRHNEVLVPLLNFSTRYIDEDHPAPRFNLPRSTLDGERPKTVLKQSEASWVWSRRRLEPSVVGGILPIVTPDLSMSDLVNLVCANGVGVAVAIDAWNVVDESTLPEEERCCSADVEWYITPKLFDDCEPQCHRTFGGFLGRLASTHRLHLQAHEVVHERRLLGVLRLETVLEWLFSSAA
jgi:hypothetical protein